MWISFHGLFIANMFERYCLSIELLDGNKVVYDSVGSSDQRWIMYDMTITVA